MESIIPKYPLEIRTPRLTIRSATTSDAAGLYKFFTSVKNLPPGESVEPNLSIPAYEKRITRWKEMAEEGKNAFMVVTLPNPNGQREGEEELIGFGGYNTFETTEGKVLTDIGVMIDVDHQRRKYALEALCAKVEFAFGVLGVEVVRIETGLENEAFRRFIVDGVGLGGVERVEEVSYRKGVEGYIYRFGSGEWEGIRKELETAGSWLL
ncbi:hypothetical protein H072_2496 [Dactylellina haptotyla CBS 200.50]|uniref:N-acetyltransferase domain-containing protein n=1 Tax=Dactylellina haptotyla (strain CBS 200.50) TaxID=1284197 RepID=S8AKN4_DACHA|nr:hypothetical protein H072_2496 [Dactylellina haptotyla CBS 200.50]